MWLIKRDHYELMGAINTKMNWEFEYNQQYQILKDEGYNIESIDIDSIQRVIIFTILLSIYGKENKTKILSFLNLYQHKSNNVNLCNYLRILTYLIIDNDTTINKSAYLNDFEKYENLLKIDFLELEFISNSLKYINDLKSENIEATMSQIETKLSSMKKYSPYFQLLQNFRSKVYMKRLQLLQDQNKWSLYLTSSYHILQECLFSDHNSIFRLWYEENPHIIEFILPNFFKSLLLEQYGYFKKSILNKFKNMSFKGSEIEIILEIHKISLNEFIKLSTFPYNNLFNDKEYEIVFNNLIALNIIKASEIFTTIKIQTLYKLCDFNPNYDIENLFDIILKLSQSRKIMVKIDEFDERLEFPIHKKSIDFKLNQMFNEILPKTLERDWDAFI